MERLTTQVRATANALPETHVATTIVVQTIAQSVGVTTILE
jgi:hypothetical protein